MQKVCLQVPQINSRNDIFFFHSTDPYFLTLFAFRIVLSFGQSKLTKWLNSMRNFDRNANVLFGTLLTFLNRSDKGLANKKIAKLS